MANMHEVAQGVQAQGCDEEISYKITTTNWGSDPTSIAVVARDEEIKEYVTDAVFPLNDPQKSGDDITLSPLKNLNSGRSYRIEVKFTSGGNVFECYFRVECNL